MKMSKFQVKLIGIYKNEMHEQGKGTYIIYVYLERRGKW